MKLKTLRPRSIKRKFLSGDEYFQSGQIKYAAGKAAAARKDMEKAAHLGNQKAKWLLREIAGLND
ncbi:MAG: hypothetical protein HW387_1615 [Parachlamydiales bacterium]|nr:hypothetical protein [Parachlamydiales bacterium]